MKIKKDDKIHKSADSDGGGIMRLPRPVQAALAAVWIAIVCVCFFNRDKFSVDEVLRFTPSEPWLAALIMLLLFALKSLSVVVYCGILYAADGILFSLPVAILMNILGTAVMVSVPYFIGRRRGADKGIPRPQRFSFHPHGKAYRTSPLRHSEPLLRRMPRKLPVLPCRMHTRHAARDRNDATHRHERT